MVIYLKRLLTNNEKLITESKFCVKHKYHEVKKYEEYENFSFR